MAPGLAGRWQRLNGPARIGGVDLARGLAVIGMFAAHLLATADHWDWSDPSTWLFIVDGRSSILFATLAGVSIGLVTGGAVPLSGDRLRTARGRLAVRAGMLWLTGILLILTGVPVYVILPAYAILFLLALPFTTWTSPALFWAAGGIGAVMAFLQPALNELPLWHGPFGEEISAALGWNYPFPVWIAFVLAGLGIARADVRRLRTQLWMLGAGSALAFVGYLEFGTPTDSTYLQQVFTAYPHSSGLYEVFGTGGFAIAVIGACLLICRLTVLRMLVLPLRATGAMPLTAYTAQLLIWAVVALAAFGDTDDLMAFRALEPFWPLTIGTIIACTAWALLVGRGPLEWLLDRTARVVVPARPRMIGRLNP
ncbi:heparan-alpha-glucosaminide N-acetyltransferase domain-containing protein [Microbacterium sp. NPDC056234]|uniref:heparan-alpha-glucosaminide N-acetyltransferase domain-containing protein n=1 Tax=Microbacterium sp. NPDC056234 TaxID=3345757 RepID=UPI0035E2D4F2